MRTARVILLTLVLLMMIGSANANGFYVDNVLGNNSNLGTSISPFATIQYALTQLNSSVKTVYIVGNEGTEYNQQVIIDGRYRPSDIRLIGIGESRPVINNSGTVDEGAVKFGIHNQPTSGTKGVYFENIHIINPISSGVVFSWNSGSHPNVTFENCSLYAGGQGFRAREASRPNNFKFLNSSGSSGGALIFGHDAANHHGEIHNITISNSYLETRGPGAAPVNFVKYFRGDLTVTNNVINSSWDGISITNSAWSDYTIALGLGNNVSGFSIITPKNLYIDNNTISAWFVDGNRGSGINIAISENVTISNNHILKAHYTGLKPIGVRNATIFNNVIYADAGGHNKIETKGKYVHYYNNTAIGYNSSFGDSYHVWYGAGTQNEGWFTVEDSYSNNTKGRWILTGGHQQNTIFRNMTGDNHQGEGIHFFGFYHDYYEYLTSNNLVVDNISLNYTNYTVPSLEFPVTLLNLGTSKDAKSHTDYANYTRDVVSLIDIKINDFPISNRMFWVVDHYSPSTQHMADVYIINANKENTYWMIKYPETCNSVLHFMKYPNIRVIDNLGRPVENANLTFVANRTNPETGVPLLASNLDYGDYNKGYTDLISSTTTNEFGKIPNRFEDSSKAIALTSHMVYNNPASETATYTEYVQWDVTATKDGQSQTITITPDMLKYSPDSSDIQSTLVTLTLDVEGCGEPVESLFITESSPTDSTPTIAAGQSQTFSVTLNKPSSITWYVNAVETEIVSGVLTDTFSYGAGQAAGEYNIVATAVNGTDSQIQTWTLTIEAEPVTPPVDPQEPRDRMSGPETAIALIGVLLVVLVATAIFGSLAGLITGVIDMQQTAAIVGVMVLVAVLAFVGLAVLSGISGALNL